MSRSSIGLSWDFANGGTFAGFSRVLQPIGSGRCNKVNHCRDDYQVLRQAVT